MFLILCLASFASYSYRAEVDVSDRSPPGVGVQRYHTDLTSEAVEH